MKYRLTHIAEYGAVRTIGFVLAILPYRAALFTGWILAVFSHYVVRYRTTEARRRIKQVFGTAYSTRKIRKIAWLSWRNFIFNIVDMFRLHKIDQPWIDRHIVDFEPIRDTMQAHCQTGRGAIIGSIHMGAVEVISVMVQQYGAPLFVIAAPQKNPLVGQHLFVMRSRTGIPGLQRGSMLIKSIVSQLKKGGVMAILTDIRVSPNGTSVQFLGHTASVGPGMAKFARQTGVPILPMIIRRVGWTKHHPVFFEPVTPDESLPKADDFIRMTQEVVNICDQAIRETPEQWFWYNKRWVLDPPVDAKTQD